MTCQLRWRMMMLDDDVEGEENDGVDVEEEDVDVEEDDVEEEDR